MPRTPIVALAFGCVIALLLLYLGELGLRLAVRDPGLEAIAEAERAGHPFDARTRRQVVQALRAAGDDAVPRAVPARLLVETADGSLRSQLTLEGRELLPLAGISERTTALCNETGDWAIIHSDEHGFRNPDGLWSQAPVDLVVLGDSFGMGDCVDDGENVPDRLRRRWPTTVNLAYSGNSPLLELAILSEYGSALRPRITLWFYFENDLAWFDLNRGARAPILMHYLESQETQGLVGLQPQIDALLGQLFEVGQRDEDGPVAQVALSSPTLWETARDFAKLRALRARAAGALGAVEARREPPNYALFSRVIARAHEIVRGWGGEMVVVYLPGVWNFAPESLAPSWADPEARAQVRAIAEKEGLPFIDAQESFVQHPDPLALYSFRGNSIVGSPHMNADGYATVAKRIEAWLDGRDRAPH
jgi:hypothetical protein